MDDSGKKDILFRIYHPETGVTVDAERILLSGHADALCETDTFKNGQI
jgi:hypothetical protein